MTITPYEFFYDAQQRRFLEQIVRAFSGFSYQQGRRNAAPLTLMVPCELALTNRQVANIRANLSENTLNTVPKITVWQTGLRGRMADLQNPAFVDRLQVFEREIINNQYGPNLGNSYSVERIMPLPFTMEVQVDVWTSNLEQKYQLIEQILVNTYPEFEIQNSDNPLDWTAVSICFVDEDITFSSRTIPVGTNEDIDIFTLRLRVPIWLTAPAKIRKLTRIEEIVANVGDLQYDQLDAPYIGTLYQQEIITPGDHFISVDGATITLLGAHAGAALPDGSIPSWTDLFNLYGKFNPMDSELHVLITSDINGPFVSGTLQAGGAVNQLAWTINTSTLPANTLLAVNAVIDPLKTFPSHGLPAVVDGVRYMLINDIGPSQAWGTVTAYTNDIIQYNTTLGAWEVSFSHRTTEPQFVLNLYTGRQLVWNGQEWVMAIDNVYGPGYWRLAL